MSTIARVSDSYRTGSLSNKIQQFIEATSETNAYQQRSHSHHSLLNTYMVATFMEEASQLVPPLKRDAGLRDLAQRLHLWPGDIAMELQRDALKAIELLEKYVLQSLDTELRYVKGLVTREVNFGDVPPAIRLQGLTEMRDEAVKYLALLKTELKDSILKHHLEFASMDLELHDLAPFIPGFTSAARRSKVQHPNQLSPSTSQSIMALSATLKEKFPNARVMSTEQLEALAAIEQFREKANVIGEELTLLIVNGSSETLGRNMEKMTDIQQAFEMMGSKVYTLLMNNGGENDAEEDGVD